MKHRIAVAAFVLLAGCLAPPYVPVTPPGPGPGPGPGPVDPTPPLPASSVAPWASVELVVLGMTRAQVDDALKVAPAFDTAQDDGTRIASYPSLGPAGELQYVVVRFRGGLVVGRSRSPRAR